ncbi:MAG: hypothetical protein Q4G27_00070 [Flavobacteriaceae bacterium]|nr:hypothetical protein [Flavobacteriaceae bacterium]
MKFIFTLFILIYFTSCYVYKPLELKEDEPLPALNEQLIKDKYYEITSGGKKYKIKAVQWDGDSLVAHVNMKEKNLIKFHKNDISQVEHRSFSRGRSDALTVGVYAGIAALILLLFQ